MKLKLIYIFNIYTFKNVNFESKQKQLLLGGCRGLKRVTTYYDSTFREE